MNRRRPDCLDALCAQVFRRSTGWGMPAIKEKNAAVAGYGVGREPVLNVKNLESHGMRSSVTGPTYQALTALLQDVLGLTCLAKFSWVT